MKSARRPAPWRNWSGSVQCEPNHCAHPVTIEQVQSEVLRAAEEGERLRVIGSGMSFSPLCWSDDNHMVLDRYTGIESADVQRRRVWVRAGTSLAALHESLAERGWALENAPTNGRQTLAGAIATGSHGSGAAFGNLASLVTGLRLVTADGKVRRCSAEQEPQLFDAARISLGALGVITHVELQCVDDYRLRRRTRRATLGETLARIDDLRRDHRNVELYWFPHTGMVLQRLLDETRDLPPRLSALSRLRQSAMDDIVFPLASQLARRAPVLTERSNRLILRAAGRRDDVFEAQAAYGVRRRLRYDQLEYAIPVARVADCLHRLDPVLRALGFRSPLPVEIRFVQRDRAWLSPQYERDSACVALPGHPGMDMNAFFAAASDLFDRADGRPHWASLHDKTADELRSLYPRFDDFCQLRRQLDPRGVFLNPHLAGLFGETLR